MPNEFKPVLFKDLKMTPEELKLVADGAAVFMAPAHDPRDDERYIEAEVDEPAP